MPKRSKTVAPLEIDPFKKEREEYDRKSAAAAAREMAARAGGVLVEATVAGERKVPGRVFEINWDLFTEKRRALVDEAIANTIKWPVYVFGEVGVGKTYLAAAVYQNWPTGTPLWLSYSQFCDRCERLRDGRGICVPKNQFESRDITSFEEWWRYLSMFDLIVIDDFGILDDLQTGNLPGDVLQSRRYRNEWMIELMDQRTGRPLFLTGNLAVENTTRNNRLKSIHEVFDLRLIDRLKAGRPLEIYGRDLRIADYSRGFESTLKL